MGPAGWRSWSLAAPEDQCPLLQHPSSPPTPCPPAWPQLAVKLLRQLGGAISPLQSSTKPRQQKNLLHCLPRAASAGVETRETEDQGGEEKGGIPLAPRGSSKLMELL